MAVLDGDIGTDTLDLWLDVPLGNVGDVARYITVESEDMFVLVGLGTTHLLVQRGENATDQVPHVRGTSVTLSSGGYLTSMASIQGASGSEMSLAGQPSENDGTSTVTLGNDGFVYVTTGSYSGDTGQSLVVGSSNKVVWGGVASGTAVPTEAADFVGSLPIYIESGTAVYFLAGTAVVGPWDAA